MFTNLYWTTEQKIQWAVKTKSENVFMGGFILSHEWQITLLFQSITIYTVVIESLGRQWDGKCFRGIRWGQENQPENGQIFFYTNVLSYYFMQMWKNWKHFTMRFYMSTLVSIPNMNWQWVILLLLFLKVLVLKVWGIFHNTSIFDLFDQINALVIIRDFSQKHLNNPILLNSGV